MVIACKRTVSCPLIWKAEANVNGQYNWWLILERVIISVNYLHQKDFLKFKVRRKYLGALHSTPILNKVNCEWWKHMFQKDSFLYWKMKLSLSFITGIATIIANVITDKSWGMEVPKLWRREVPAGISLPEREGPMRKRLLSLCDVVEVCGLLSHIISWYSVWFLGTRCLWRYQVPQKTARLYVQAFFRSMTAARKNGNWVKPRYFISVTLYEKYQAMALFQLQGDAVVSGETWISRKDRVVMTPLDT